MRPKVKPKIRSWLFSFEWTTFDSLFLFPSDEELFWNLTLKQKWTFASLKIFRNLIYFKKKIVILVGWINKRNRFPNYLYQKIKIKVLKLTFETESGFFAKIVTDRQYNFLANDCIVMFLLQKSSISTANIWITFHSSTFIQIYIHMYS